MITAKNYKAVVKGKVLGCAIVKRANSDRYKDPLKNLRTRHSYGQDLYLETVEMAHNILNKHELLNAQKNKPGGKK